MASWLGSNETSIELKQKRSHQDGRPLHYFILLKIYKLMFGKPKRTSSSRRSRPISTNLHVNSLEFTTTDPKTQSWPSIFEFSLGANKGQEFQFVFDCGESWIILQHQRLRFLSHSMTGCYQETSLWLL